uniref:Uncharacterized protein n=1 Tax=Opuntia streptacantha TaxID=393608 RepID=A0A7C9DZC0_OPUST
MRISPYWGESGLTPRAPHTALDASTTLFPQGGWNPCSSSHWSTTWARVLRPLPWITISLRHRALPANHPVDRRGPPLGYHPSGIGHRTLRGRPHRRPLQSC